MAQKRWIETFSRTRIGYSSESTAFTAEAALDMDGTLKTNFAITNRVKQYFDKDTPVVVKNTAVVQAASLYTLQRLGGFARFAAAFGSTPTITFDGAFIPMYLLKGGRNMSNTAQRAEIDTTSNGDFDMTGAGGRAKVGGGFAFIPGATFTNAAAKVVTFKNMIEATADAGGYVVLEHVNDTTDTVNLPRDAFFCTIGNTDMQRNLNAAIEQPITWYLATCDDSRSRSFIDYIA